MAGYKYEVEGWRDIHGNQFEGVPTQKEFWGPGGNEEIDGLLIKHWDPDDRDSVEWHWVFQTVPWDDMDSTFGDIDFMVTVTYGPQVST